MNRLRGRKPADPRDVFFVTYSLCRDVNELLIEMEDELDDHEPQDDAIGVVFERENSKFYHLR